MSTQIGELGVTFPDATLQTTAAVPGAPGLGIPNMAVFTANSFWIVPTGITRCRVTVVGGGGGGGCSFPNLESWGGSGGGGGGTAIKTLTNLTPGTSINIVVGVGGIGTPILTDAQAGTGGTSSFGSYCSATGGAGGGPSYYGRGDGGTGGIGINGDLNLAGNGGGFGSGTSGGGSQVGGVGGGSMLGGGATVVGFLAPTAGSNGRAYGGGGAGSIGFGTGNGVAGGNGYAGVVIVEY